MGRENKKKRLHVLSFVGGEKTPPPPPPMQRCLLEVFTKDFK